MPSNKPVFAVRTTEDIKQKLEHIAKENNRSASKEIEYLIKNISKDMKMTTEQSNSKENQ